MVDQHITWQFYKDEAGEHRWRAKDSRNGNVLFISAEGYSRKVDAVVCAARAGYDSESTTEE